MSLRRACCAGWYVGVLLGATWASAVREAKAQSCNHWSDMFPGDGGLGFDVRALLVHDGELYLGGRFDTCMSSRTVNYVARWNGRRWAGVGKGPYIDEYHENYAYSLTAFDDPNTPEGPVLYGGTEYGVYREPNDPDDANEAWPQVAATDAPVRALVAYQGALYAGGEFTEIAGQAANHIARWNGTSWEEVGGGVRPDPNDPNSPPAKVLALTVFDDGAGEALFAAGTFMYAGPYPNGVTAKRVARWRNDTWSALADGIDDPNNVEVDALAGWDDDGIRSLYVGGTFSAAGGVQARRIAAAQCDANDPNAWTWSALGPGLWGPPGGPASVTALAVLEVGPTAALYVGGAFESVGDPNDPNSLPVGRIARWDGAAWSALSDGFDEPVYALTGYDDGFGSAVYAGGSFRDADGLKAPRIARFKGGKWSPLGRAPDSTVFALCSVYDWHHPRVFVGGAFQNVGALRTGGLAWWDGTTWSGIAGAPGQLWAPIYALTTFDDASGLDLFIGSGPSFILEGEGEEQGSIGYIARGRMVEQAPNSWKWIWTNTSDPNDANPTITSDDAVCAFAEFQDPDDPNDPNDPCDPYPMLYAGGEFTKFIDPNDPNAVGPSYIARWNGQSWEPVGPNDPYRPGGPVYALTVADLGDGAALYGAGAKWQNNTWAALPPGSNVGVWLALAAFDGALYAGGNAGRRVAKWNGDPNSPWEQLGGGIDAGQVLALHVFDDGDGDALYVGCYGINRAFNDPNSCGQEEVLTHMIGRWDGTCWETVGHSLGDHVYALRTFRDGLSAPDEPAGLYAGGHFFTAGNDSSGDTDSQHIARWGCLTACRGDLNHDFAVNFGDINPFVLALINPAGYAETYPGLAETNLWGTQYTGGLVLFLGDLNCDGSVSFGDINPFVQRLNEGCCHPNCGTCPSQGDGGDMNRMNGGGEDDTGGGLSPEQMAALLAANVDPADYDSLLARIAEYVAQQENPDEAAYWEAVYNALIQ